MFEAVSITITMNEKGEINVNGPLENKLVMFGLLEIAKDTVIEYNRKKQTSIVAPPLNFVLPANGGRG